MIGSVKVLDLGGLSEQLVETKLLSIRPDGEIIRNEIISIAHSIEEDIILLDFSNVLIIDFSCSDEIIAVLQENTKLLSGKRIILSNLTKSHQENIQMALKERKQAVWALDKLQGYYLIGHLQGNLESILAFVTDRKRVTARELADDLGEELASVSLKLGKLYKGGLINRIEDRSPEGMQYIYTSLF
ncbi:hypothetical protein [Brevibacillus sp. 1238]|uniref:hypothetical protein n=1 Tax=Brevibacillus sp. 1238 TaxID=2940565 RepID=UPI002474EED2|nr:hypothetical protein [Brevibacillus sp. 1238]MDH6351950.1 DNA-binding transcriptional ArsR family regulator [Brevibacillus sp. 1238]